ncbi:ATP-binding cassette domain-containing protein [Mangrovibacillus sp. Mu-81]|jgi:putative ABC transport system ATP-binding protein|uniref:ABC transporter ATP-binding protein n=1 Tax=Mangrovibacillus sp. Mu-81 TaxID=3121478 RepID=UPI002FE46DA7
MPFTLRNLVYKDILKIGHMDIPENKTTCFIGESGAGKSTLLKLLNKMYIPDKGSIHYKGTSLGEMDAVTLRRKIVMIPQTPLLFGESIEENLQKGLLFSEKSPASRGDLERVLEIVRLDKNLQDQSEKLSGGERQRLSLGRVLLMRPEVYLLDEPTSALDEETELTVMKKFVEAAKSHDGTVIIVTHSMKVAEQYGEEVIKISKQ